MNRILVSLAFVVSGATMMSCVGPARSVRTLTLSGVEFQGATESGEPNLFVSPDGRVLMSWLEPTQDGDALLVAQRHRRIWGSPVKVYESSSLFVNWADFPSVTELSDGAWLAHWLERAGDRTYAYHARASISRDRGATWSDPWTIHDDLSPTEHGFVSVVPSADGSVDLLWLDGRSTSDHEGGRGAMQIRSRRVGPDGMHRSETLVDDRVCDCCQTALARTPQGLVAAYRDRSVEEIRDIAVSRLVDGAWTDPVHVGAEGWHIAGCPVNGPALSASGDTVALAWFTAAGGEERVFLAVSHDGASTFGPPIRIDDQSPLGRVDVEITASGPLVVWMERSGDAAEIRAKTVAWDGDVGPASHLATVSQTRRSGFPRIVVTGDEVVLAWTVVGGDGGIRVAAAPLD